MNLAVFTLIMFYSVSCIYHCSTLSLPFFLFQMIPEVTEEIPKFIMNFNKSWMPPHAESIRKITEGVIMAATVILCQVPSKNQIELIGLSFRVIISWAVFVSGNNFIKESPHNLLRRLLHSFVLGLAYFGGGLIAFIPIHFFHEYKPRTIFISIISSIAIVILGMIETYFRKRSYLKHCFAYMLAFGVSSILSALLNRSFFS